MEIEKQERIKGTSMLAAAMLIWGLNFVITKIALVDIAPFPLMLFRHTLSTFSFIGILVVRGINVFDLTRKHWKKILPLGILGIVFNQLFFLWGMNHTSPSHSALMFTIMPIFSSIFALFILKEKITFFRWVGIALAFSGAVWLATDGKLNLDSSYLYGDLITIGAVVAFALFLVLAKPVLEEVGVIRTLGVAYLLSSPFILVVCLMPALEQDWSSISTESWLSALYLVVFGTVIAYLCHQYALKRLPAALVAAFAYSQPILAAIFSVIILGETLPASFYLAAALIIGGLMIARKKQRIR